MWKGWAVAEELRTGVEGEGVPKLHCSIELEGMDQHTLECGLTSLICEVIVGLVASHQPVTDRTAPHERGVTKRSRMSTRSLVKGGTNVKPFQSAVEPFKPVVELGAMRIAE